MTRANTAISGVILVIGLVAIAIALPRAQAGAAKPPAGARQGGVPDQGGRSDGRGGGRDANPTAALFIEQCSGCHGTDLAGGRAPSLFNEQWLAATTDERIANAIRNGVPNTAMAPFKSLTDEQIWQLTHYMRTQSGVLKTRPAFVVNLDGAVVKSEKQTVRMEVLAKDLDTPWGRNAIRSDRAGAWLGRPARAGAVAARFDRAQARLTPPEIEGPFRGW